MQAQALRSLQFLKDESGNCVGSRRRQQVVAFKTVGQRLAAPELCADCATQLAERRHDRQMLHLHATLALLVGEDGADALAGHNLPMLVVGHPEPGADRLDTHAADAPFTARLKLVLQHVDARILARNAVERVVAREGDADKAARPNQRTANREALVVDERVRHSPLRRIVVAGAALEGIGMHGEAAGAGSDLEGAIGAAVHRVQPTSRLDAEPARRNDLGNAIVDGTDHPPDRL
jgi:hypothetical protein